MLQRTLRLGVHLAGAMYALDAWQPKEVNSVSRHSFQSLFQQLTKQRVQSVSLSSIRLTNLPGKITGHTLQP